MSYAIEIVCSAARNLNKIPVDDRNRVIDAIRGWPTTLVRLGAGSSPDGRLGGYGSDCIESFMKFTIPV